MSDHPKTLLLCPRAEELVLLDLELALQGWAGTRSQKLRFPSTVYPDQSVIVAIGGQGKVTFALHTQHALEHWPSVETVICLGSAGALTDRLPIGDVVVAQKIVEHDYKSQLKKQVNHSISHETVELMRALNAVDSQRLHVGAIASGDEDVFSPQRRQELFDQTGALAVAWEGAGGVRASRFFKKNYIEIRGITDHADQLLSHEAHVKSLPHALNNAIALTLTFLKSS